jgi:ferredoxin
LSSEFFTPSFVLFRQGGEVGIEQEPGKVYESTAFKIISSDIGGEMKIIIDKDKCKGHNNCISIAPNVFEVDEKFKAFVLDPKGDSDEDILKAAKACPELAIILEDETSGRQIFPGPDDKPRNQLGGSKWGG